MSQTLRGLFGLSASEKGNRANLKSFLEHRNTWKISSNMNGILWKSYIFNPDTFEKTMQLKEIDFSNEKCKFSPDGSKAAAIFRDIDDEDEQQAFIQIWNCFPKQFLV